MLMRWIFWPVEQLIKLVGRLVAVILGFVFLIIGSVLCFTVIGMIIGVPMAIFGLLLLVKGLF
jgi:hypothetical protein